MGLFSKLKRQLLEVIEWTDNSKDTIVYKYPLTDRDEIMNSSTLVVRESQAAIFMHKGQIADVFGPGTYKLTTENIPFLTKLLSLPTGFNSRIKADIYYVNTKQFTGNKWGTQNPIMMRDPEFGNIRLRGFGVFAFKVDDPAKFMKEMFGTNNVFTTESVVEQCKPAIVQAITDTIAENKISALDLAANYKEFSKQIKECGQDGFAEFGLKLTNITIENLSLPEEVEKALDEKTTLGVLGDKMGTYTHYQTAKAIRDVAQNTGGGGAAGIGVGLGAGRVMGRLFANNLNDDVDEKETKKEKLVACKKCGAKIKANAKFCPECGEKQGLTCPKCGETISANAKFCPNCGEKISQGKICPKCGAECKKTAKFCPECGEKI